MNRGELARWGEDLACRHMEEEGFLLLARNYRCPRGEVDIVASKADLLVFAEVKTRRTLAFGLPQESVAPWKQRRLQIAGHWFLVDHKIPEHQYTIRFDVITVYYIAKNYQVSWFRDAF